MVRRRRYCLGLPPGFELSIGHLTNRTRHWIGSRHRIAELLDTRSEQNRLSPNRTTRNERNEEEALPSECPRGGILECRRCDPRVRSRASGLRDDTDRPAHPYALGVADVADADELGRSAETTQLSSFAPSVATALRAVSGLADDRGDRDGVDDSSTFRQVPAGAEWVVELPDDNARVSVVVPTQTERLPPITVEATTPVGRQRRCADRYPRIPRVRNEKPPRSVSHLRRVGTPHPVCEMKSGREHGRHPLFPPCAK